MGSDLRAENFMETLTLTALSEQNPKLRLVNDETDGHLHVPNRWAAVPAIRTCQCTFAQDVSVSIGLDRCA